VSAVLQGSAAAGAGRLTWILALAGFIVMYLPTYWDAAQGVWQTDEMAHGPIVAAVVIWALWRSRQGLARAVSAPRPVAGWSFFGLGVALYLLARTFVVGSLEFASQLFVVAGAVLLLHGACALRAVWFPVAYMAFLIPLPASFVDTVTGPLKHWISLIVVDVLYLIGLPIARSGVTISIGPYQLLVADACSGLNSMFGLAAIGALFMYVMRRPGWTHNATMLVSILPIAFMANIVRVACLVLVTYKFGDEAGQGFLHGAAGMLLFLVALTMFVALDSLLGVLLPSGSARD
jgi:exosortase B